MSLSSDNSRLFVANPALGVVGEVDLNTLQVVRSTSFVPTGDIGLAKFGGGTPGPATGGMVLSMDGSMLYLADTTGVLAMTTSDLKVKARLLPGTAVVSLGLADNGKVLYAVRRNGSAVRVDPTDGAVIQELDGSGYVAVLRVVTPG